MEYRAEMERKKDEENGKKFIYIYIKMYCFSVGCFKQFMVVLNSPHTGSEPNRLKLD